MARERSPNYPQIPLETAVQSVRALFKKESRTAVPPEVAVQAWNYQGMSGPARVRIAALRQYGLVESEKSGKIKVSTRGMALSMRSPDSPEYIAALKESALTPAIFRELYENQNGASDEALKYHLVADRKFSPDGARRLIQAYRATVELANLGQMSYDVDADADEADADIDRDRDEEMDDTPAGRDGRVPSTLQYRVQLTDGIIAEVTFRGGNVTPRALRVLRAHLKLAEVALTSADDEEELDEVLALATRDGPIEHGQQL